MYNYSLDPQKWTDFDFGPQNGQFPYHEVPETISWTNQIMIGKVFLYEKLTISYDGPYDMVNTLAREKL